MYVGDKVVDDKRHVGAAPHHECCFFAVDAGHGGKAYGGVAERVFRGIDGHGLEDGLACTRRADGPRSRIGCMANTSVSCP